MAVKTTKGSKDTQRTTKILCALCDFFEHFVINFLLTVKFYSRRKEENGSKPFEAAKEEVAFDCGVFIAVAAMNGIFAYRLRI